MNIHIVEQPEVIVGSAAVFTLPSPALDHSGIGHLVEHLVFRTSAVFPERHNLFALTSLTRCKMNASTTGNKSYYFAQADTAEDLLLLIEYLYAGLMTHTYAARDIEQEKSVIQHELAFYAKHPAYQKQSQIWRGDQHPDAYQHWGGLPDILAQLTADDVYAYKSQYYQDSAISLIASGVT
ncbi:MAG: insulinase family protein, partial [Glaciecola sp.]